MKTRALIVGLFLSLSMLLVVPAEVPEDRGAMGLSQALNRLDVIASVLHTGAHPDDENSALLAALSRGKGARVAYLSATRGDGGQNLLGTELFEALGVIRTEELLAARRADHGLQFFTPVYEFGFSKSADEAFEKWGKEAMLGDFVRVIRQFRPEIIVSRFRGTSADGHGHHQAAGIITQEAFKAAADPARFPEYGKPWQSKKLYLNGGAGGGGQGNAQNPAATPAPVSITVSTGDFDIALGRSYGEIAAEGRSLHRSQGQGTVQNRGPGSTSLQLVQKSVDVAESADLFVGVLYKLPDLAQIEPSLGADLTQLQQRITTVRQKASLARPSDLVPDLIAGLKQIQQIRARAANDHAKFLLQQKEEDFQEAVRLAAGLVLDVLADDETVVPGQQFRATVSIINGGPYAYTGASVNFDLPAGWEATLQPPQAEGQGGGRGGRGGGGQAGGARGGGQRGGAAAAPAQPGVVSPGQKYDQVYAIKVPANATFTQPYWLQEPRKGDRFVWPVGSAVNMPFDPALLLTHASVNYDGASIVLNKSAEFRSSDRMYGEERADIKVVPALSVRITPEVAVIPLGGKRQKEFTVQIENQSTTAVDGDVRLVVPQGWTVTPATPSSW
jgi:LmbE family N-acetylglucosaminyl deacetylase